MTEWLRERAPLTLTVLRDGTSDSTPTLRAV
jgi:hypothetical protein